MQDLLKARAAKDSLDPILAPKASRVAGKVSDLAQPSIGELEKIRRVIGRDVAGAADPTERAIGMGMKDELSGFMDDIGKSDVTGGNPDAAIDALKVGRETTRKIKKSEDIQDVLYKAKNRAATSGTGGNEVNAIRQNIRGILDNPRKRRGYTEQEISAMEDIVRGTPTQNALRMLGKLSPTSGTLPAMAGAAAGTGFGLVGAIPSAGGYLAKGGAEMMTNNSVNNLDVLIRNGAPLATKSLSGQQKSALQTLLLSQIANRETSAP
jgi:hypothetical protein